MSQLKKIWNAYIKGKASVEEKKELLKELENNQQQAKISSWMREIWKNSDPEAADKLRDDALFLKIKEQTALKAEAKVIKPSFAKSVLRYAVAASFMGLMGLTMWWYLFKVEQPTQWVHLALQEGEQVISHELPDGSKVWLNAGTLLDYDKDFLSNRALQLSGEAYFEVAKNRELPFRVKFGNNELLVTGTQFNIKAYANEDKTKVHVKEGSVSVFSPKDTNQLIYDNYLVIHELSGAQVKSEIAFEELQGWKEGSLVFKNASLTEVFNSIERYYGVGISRERTRLEKTEPLTATYQKNTKLKDVLEGLKYLQEIKYEFITPDSLSIEY